MNNTETAPAMKPPPPACEEIESIHTLAEAEELLQSLRNMEAASVETGCSHASIAELVWCIDAAYTAEKIYREKQDARETACANLDICSRCAVDLRDELISSITMVYYFDPVLMKHLSNIATSDCEDDIILDLFELAAFGRDRRENLLLNNIDLSRFALAETLAMTMESYLDAATRSSYREHTSLIEMLDELREVMNRLDPARDSCI